MVPKQHVLPDRYRWVRTSWLCHASPRLCVTVAPLLFPILHDLSPVYLSSTKLPPATLRTRHTPHSRRQLEIPSPTVSFDSGHQPWDAFDCGDIRQSLMNVNEYEFGTTSWDSQERRGNTGVW